ncbi:C13 family peptidase [Azomonas macrocytogenes]|uniref:Caspase family p20 domain-containing protein n=1 Tax=Azomonas macrocytogenes TaxID=69962 RepID=A0A839T0I6_AZOMA|nr:C13 family peptidase [Azomonas macrocytogenes]MBB3102499.1 hypothetical protein [Azomonas macrocytogenes]
MRHHLLLFIFFCLLCACGDTEPLSLPDAILPDGGRYRGTVENGLLQGVGRIDYPNGSWYRGNFQNGHWHGQGHWQGSTGDRYTGEFRNGLFHGHGRFTYADGSWYEGDFQEGHMYGLGTFRQGEVRYTGEFRKDRYHGHGRLEYSDESYEGNFVVGVLNGEGEYRNAAGDHYQGRFANDRFQGQGRYEGADGDVWTGVFRDGTLDGAGQHQGTDGTLYQGQFRQWRYHGQGYLELPDGSHYQGEFRDGLFDGFGELQLADGTAQQGQWRAGRRIADASGQSLPDPLEVGLLVQGRLLEEAIARLPHSTPARELYALTLAGDGQQSVFLREADYVAKLLHERFAARGTITLINHREHLADRPMATRQSLARAIQALAERSGREDLIFLYFTSHGSEDHELTLEQPRLALENLPANGLARLLEPLADRDKVIIVSACYSGGFINPLKNRHTLIMTSARTDRASFGCTETSNLTYFGQALFAEALQQTKDLKQAFELARKKIAEREQAARYSPSDPQLWAPPEVLGRWRSLQQDTAFSGSCPLPGVKPCI